MISEKEARELLLSLLPPGSEQLYLTSDRAVIGRLFTGLGQAVRTSTLLRVEQLHLELNPSTMFEKISDWEEACGLSSTPIARFGTPEQRRNACLAVLRTSGSFSLDDIRAIVQPYFLYKDPSQIEIIETDRDLLRAAHTYSTAPGVVIPSGGNYASAVLVADDPLVSAAGAQLQVNISGNAKDAEFVLYCPDGSTTVFGPSTLPAETVATKDYVLHARQFAGHAIKGRWTLIAYAVASPITLHSWGVFVEGIGVNFDGAVPPKRLGEGLGAAMFQFAVVADPALLGTGYDLQGAERSLNRWKPAHTGGTVVLKSGVFGASSYAIPDTASATPDAALPGPP